MGFVDGMLLSKREKLLVLSLGIFLGLLALYLIGSKLGGYEGELIQDAARKQSQLERVRVLDASLREYGAKSSTGRRGKQSLISLIEQLAEQSSLKQRIQLNRVPLDKSKGIEGIDIKLDEMSLDEMMNFIFLLENKKPTLVIEQLDITSSFRSKDQLRISIRVLAQI